MATTSQLGPAPALFAAGTTFPTTKSVSLKVNALWTILGNGAYAAAQWLQLALLAHLGTTRDVGRYAYATAIATPIFMLFNLQLRSVQATDAQRRYTFSEYLGLRTVCSVCALFAILLLSFPASDSGTAAVLTILVALFKSAESISDIYQGLLQQSERMDFVGRSFLLKGALLLGAFSLAYSATHNILAATGAMLIGQILVLVLYDMRAAARVANGAYGNSIRSLRSTTKISCESTRLLKLARYALPLGISTMLISLYSNVPRFVIKTYAGAEGVGIFAAISCLPLIGGLVVTAVGTAITPRLAQYATRDMGAYKRLLLQFSLAAAALGISGAMLSVLFGPTILSALYGPEYALHSSVFTWTMLAGALSYCTSAVGFGATAMGCFKEQVWIVGIATGLLLISSYALVPAHGLDGAAIAVFIAVAASLIGYTALLVSRIKR